MVGATATVPVSRSPPKRCVAASTRARSVDCAVKSPVKRSRNDASVSLVRIAEAMVRPAIGGAVVSWKLDGESRAPNTVPDSSTRTVASCRFVSVSDGGTVPATRAEASGTVTANVTAPRSPGPSLLSLSSTVTVTVVVVAAVGVPHTVRSVAQFGRPSDRPAGRPVGV